jgi:probable F420-dependent oxidoreductase
MAAVTERLRFTTNIYVGPVRDLFTVAKSVSTAAVLSGGRVALGVAAGWCREEYDQTGQDFSTRGRRLDEMIPALRALWSGGMAEYHGEFFDFGPLQMAPAPPAPVPVWIGGDSDAALRRAAQSGDGWVGNAYEPADADAVLTRLRAALRDASRDEDDFEVVLGVRTRLTPELVQRYADRGVTGLLCAPWMRAADGSAADRLAAVESFADRYLAALQGGTS